MAITAHGSSSRHKAMPKCLLLEVATTQQLSSNNPDLHDGNWGGVIKTNIVPAANRETRALEGRNDSAPAARACAHVKACLVRDMVVLGYCLLHSACVAGLYNRAHIV